MGMRPSSSAGVPVTSTSPTVSVWLDKRIKSGTLDADAQQRGLAQKFDALIEALRPGVRAPKTSALGWFLARKPVQAQHPVRGLYIHGGVGRGKTMLMDIFFKRCPDPRKRRAHFHDFMVDVHDRINAHRALLKEGKTKQFDPIVPVAEALAAEARIICFDEFAVTDIADAMILSRLFEALFAHGVVLVATSNVAPENLYRHGLNRELFLPFLELLQTKVETVAFDAGHDYRADTLAATARYITPLGPEADIAFEAAFKDLTRGANPESLVLQVMGRSLLVPASVLGVAKFSFDDLCRKPLAARDYLALCRAHHTLFISNIPVLGGSERNEAKRFILLIDTIYDNHLRLVVSAAAEPVALYGASHGTEVFEFARTASRLTEMRGADWPPVKLPGKIFGKRLDKILDKPLTG
jgi:cell division protein ZapE